jgi:glutaredoxin
MKKITMFTVDGCPYCAKARKAIAELTAENQAYGTVPIEEISETQHPEIAEGYDYWATPAFFTDHEKLFEAHLGQSYEEIRDNVMKVLDKAME